MTELTTCTTATGIAGPGASSPTPTPSTTARSGRATLAAVLAGTALLLAGLGGTLQTPFRVAVAATTHDTPAPMGGMAMCSDARRATIKPMMMDEGPLQMEMYPTTCKAPTWSEVDRVYRTLATARAATLKYRDVRVAMRDGYFTAPVLFVAGQGYHYVNPLYVPGSAREFDAAHPPVLVYNKIGGRMTLSGLMYYLPHRTTARQLATIFPASMASWHRHVNICVASDGKTILPVHARAACQARGAQFIPGTGWMVHAWLHRAGAGLFDMDM